MTDLEAMESNKFYLYELLSLNRPDEILYLPFGQGAIKHSSKFRFRWRPKSSMDFIHTIRLYALDVQEYMVYTGKHTVTFALYPNESGASLVQSVVFGLRPNVKTDEDKGYKWNNDWCLELQELYNKENNVTLSDGIYMLEYIPSDVPDEPPYFGLMRVGTCAMTKCYFQTFDAVKMKVLL